MTVTINIAVMPSPKARICITPTPRRFPAADMAYRVVGRDIGTFMTSESINHPPAVRPSTKQTINPRTHKVRTVSSACQKINPPMVNTTSPIVNHADGGDTPSSPRKIPNTETFGSLSNGENPKPTAVTNPTITPANSGPNDGGASDKPRISSARIESRDCPA